MIKKDEEGNYSATEMGQVTAKMYMSPLDVSDWFSNFSKISSINPSIGSSETLVDKINFAVSICLGKCYSWNSPSKVYISKAEQRTRTISDFAQKLINIGKITWETLPRNPYVKYSAIFYSILRGDDIDPNLQSILYGLQQDFPRIVGTMRQVDDRYGKYHKKQDLCRGFGWGDDWEKLLYRLKYPGIAEHLWELVSIDGVGQVLANKLYSEGIKTKKDIEDPLNHYKVKAAIGEKRTEKILAEMGVSMSKAMSGPAKNKTTKKTSSKEKDKIKADGLF
jgi:replicative superfamily II helicase